MNSATATWRRSTKNLFRGRYEFSAESAESNTSASSATPASSTSSASSNSQTTQQSPPQPSQASPAQPRYNQELLDDYPYHLAPQPEEELLRWIGPSRPYKQRNRRYFSTIFTIVLLICLILFFAGQVPVVAVVIAVAFVAYVMAAIPPTQVEYLLTTYGIRIEKQLYYWEELGRFWLDDALNSRVIHIETARFPNRITLVLVEDLDENLVQELLAIVLLQEKPLPTYFEQVAAWLQSKLPLDLEA